MEIINIENLNFGYGERQILNNLSLSIAEKKLIGILGPNGCGKSTLLKNILGYLHSSSGTIKIANKNSKEFSQKEKSKLISLVPQKSQLMSAMSVEEFVLMGRLPHLENSWKGYSKEDRELAEKALNSLDLERFKKRTATTLSGGEFQRVLLARAITQDTEIILLDEPTSALDLNHAIELMEKVKEIVRKEGKTAVAVLHDLNLASLFCDELIMLKNGKLFCKGTPKEVLTKENLKEVYNLNCDIFYVENDFPYIIPKIK
ncbi:ABC transporter ATP-binding protein [uncultured Fusobacterium sp.]|uniref:ABC transporter ATP-binding protein n=1 Tax=uncultured Fusobacterium sp. TaxID=159267 RepID=UPI00280507B3|nr:ABC transporter ATP-binding protein [uncultured Fusobacterium sp.]